MKLDFKQTRRLFLAGAVPLPAQYPSLGQIVVEDGSLTRVTTDSKEKKQYSDQKEKKSQEEALQVIVREKAGIHQSITRIVLAEHVSAIFYPNPDNICDPIEDFEDG